ncbi:MAG: ABC transporter ATP-binding protein [Chloroflexota bacterium]|nr:ABC transporter ATP-binding protein [Chloroflexota bacterium]
MQAVQRLTKFLKPYRLSMVLAPLLMALEVAMDLLQPALIERIVDKGIVNLDLALVIHTGLLMVGLALIGAAGGFFNGVFAVRASQGFGADLRDALFRKVQSLSFANLDKLETGQLVTNLTNDVTQVQMALYQMLRILIRAPLLLVGSLAMVLLTTPQLAYIPLGLMAVVLLGLFFIIGRAYPLFRIVQEKLDKLNTIMQENLAGVRVVKAFVRRHYEMERFGTANDDLMERTIHVTRVIAVTMPLVMLAMNVGMVGVIWFGGIRVMTGGMTTGEIISFTNYLMRTLMALMIVSMIVLQVSRAQASAERIVTVLENEPTVQNRRAAQRDITPQGRVAFENVRFSYDSNGSAPVLKGINFVAEPGQTVALLGTTGAGKSSLVHLIPRFYDVTAGRVTFDGIDVREIDKDTLRRNIGIALQETVLFSGTIRDNIRYGRPQAGDEEVISAAKAAQAHDFIQSLPEGYATVLGQRGVNLSGGQKQRIAIARALLLQPAVLILDDSTSSVDVETEAKIQTALDDLMRDRTSLVIAQRISTVLTADKILVLDDGQIVAQGTHTELLASSPIYREIYDSQLGDGGIADV